MDDLRLDNLIDETLKTIDPVEVPKDLHFDAAKIMRLARMEEEAEAEAKREERPAPLLSLSRLRDVFQSRSWMRYAAAAAAFAVLLGVYTLSQSGEPVVPVPGGPTNVADVEIDDGQIPLAQPDDPVQDGEDPAVTPDPEQGSAEDPVQTEDPQPAVTPAPPVQSAETTPKPPAPQPAPTPATPEPETPTDVIEDEETPAVEGPEYAGGLETDPVEGEEPVTDPGEPGEGETPQEDILGSLLALAMQNESFAADFAAEDKGFGYQLLKAEDVPDGTKFMVYFYESEEEAAAQTINEENVRSILWKRESL